MRSAADAIYNLYASISDILCSSHPRRSEEVTVLHAHVETLLHHCVFQVAVGAWTDLLIRAMLMYVSRQSLEFESLLLTVKDRHVVLQDFGPRLLERARPRLRGCSDFVLWLRSIVYFMVHAVSVLPWPRYIKLQALPVENLIVVKSWRCFIESNILAREDLVIGGAALRSPLRPRVFEVVLDLVGSRAELLRALEHFLGIVLVEGRHFTLDL